MPPINSFQTEILDAPEIGYPGQIATSDNIDVVTCIAAVPVYPGRFVVDGGIDSEGNQLVEIPDTDAGSELPILGVVVRTQAVENNPLVAFPAIPAGTRFNVLRKGTIFVSTEEGIDPNSDTLFVRFTANGDTKQPGMALISDDGGKADELGVGGFGVNHRVLAITAAAGAVPVELNLPS